MQGQITLSKKEKHYQFVYLVLMLIAALLFLGIIFLKGFKSPFESSDVFSLQNLEQKAKFNQLQKSVEKNIDSTFNNISKLTIENPQPLEENEIRYGINDINEYFETAGVTDPRKQAYPQISRFYVMYFEDKKTISATTENIKKFKQAFDDCSIGYREKKQNLFNKQNALNAR